MNHPPTLVRATERPDRVVAVFSDIEMGQGGALDDFPHSAWLGDIIRGYADVRYEAYAIDLVFNGDTFDLLKTSVDGAWPRHVTSKIALAKMKRIADAHPRFFEAVRAFLGTTSGRGAAYFILGNHDPELLFPEVQAYVRDLCGGSDRVRFPGFELDIGRLHVDHGSQADPLFAMDAKKPFVRSKDNEEILGLSWGSVALLDVVIPLQPLLYHHDRLKPKKLMFELLPEVKQLLTGAFWNYWTGSYFREAFRGTDPVKTVSWTMFKEVIYRLASWDTDVSPSLEVQKLLDEKDGTDLHVFGHVHEAGWWAHGNRKVIRTGALRDEYMLVDRGHMIRPINKTYAEAFMAGEEVVRSHIVELPPPARAPGTMPHSIFDVLPEVKRRLASPEARSQQQREQKAQEAREAEEARRGK